MFIAFIILIIAALIALIYSYRRRPVRHVSYIDWETARDEHEATGRPILDLRNYNTANALPAAGTLNIPLAYLKRYYSDIPEKDIIVLTGEQTLSMFEYRLLKRKGFNVWGIVPLPELKPEDSCNLVYNKCN